MSAPIRVVLADDHPIYRAGVAQTLADAGGIEVVGQAADGTAATDLCAALRPDVVLLDISMRRGDGLGALDSIMALPDPPHVAMLTASEDEADLMRAVRGGALGYILKGVGAGELVAVVRDIAEGHSYVSPGLAGRLLIAMRGAPAPNHDGNPLESLSRREEQILQLVAEGKSNKEVGQALDLQEKTVKHYMTSILQKLHVRNRVEAALLAHRRL